MPPRDIQVNYIGEVVKLMLWRMARVMSERETPFAVALNDHVDIYRKTSYFNLDDPSATQRLRPEWDECSAQLKAILEAHLSDNDAATEAEDLGLKLLWPSLVDRIDRELPLVDYRKSDTFGCFFYHPTDTEIDLHFVNSETPQSPFKKPLDRARELYQLLEDCEENHPGLTRIKFGSWLNDYQPYRRLFPPSWRDTGERKSHNSLAWWGQFMNHAGDIQIHNANQFRNTKEFPYPCTFHQCDTAALKEHLTQLLNGL